MGHVLLPPARIKLHRFGMPLPETISLSMQAMPIKSGLYHGRQMGRASSLQAMVKQIKMYRFGMSLAAISCFLTLDTFKVLRLPYGRQMGSLLLPQVWMGKLKSGTP